MFIIEPVILMWLTFGLIAIAIGFYISEELSLEITSLGVIGTLLILFFLFPVYDAAGNNLLTIKDLLSGFADPALISVLCLLVIGQGLVQSGALDEFSRVLIARGVKSPRLIIYVILGMVLILSAIMNNTPVVVMFIPILSALALRLGKTLSHVMIPLSYAAILGGSLTLIGSSTNLLVSGALENATGEGLGFFDFTVPGAVLAVVGFLYVVLVAPRLLKDRASMAGTYILESGKQFLVQAEVTPDSFLAGKQSKAGMFPDLKDLTIRMFQRGEDSYLPPYEDITLKPGDILIIAATRPVLADLLKKSPDLLRGIIEENPEEGTTTPDPAEGGQMLAEVMIAPASRMFGRTLKQIGFHTLTDCIVLGIQRRSRMLRIDLNKTRLESGDVLLVMGRPGDILALRANKDVVLLEWSTKDLPLAHHSKMALTIFGMVVALAATGLLPIVVSALLGVAFMIGSGCLNIRQAGRAVDRRIVLLIAAALSMGAALSATGGAEFLATQLIFLTQGMGPLITLSAFFLLVAFITNVLSNNATAVLFTPIAISVATGIGVDPKVFVIAVVLAANCSFASPIGYQTNLLVMAPGHYKFSDFARVGTILIFLLWATFTAFAGWYYNLV